MSASQQVSEIYARAVAMTDSGVMQKEERKILIEKLNGR